MLLKYRTFISIALAGFFILLIAWLRSEKAVAVLTEQLLADRFWVMKAQHKLKYDVVIIGDSRVYRGVDPAEMEKYLPGMKIYNFAFSSGGLNPEIYQAAESMLNAASNNKTILMGITPGSFTAMAEVNYQYNEERHRPQSAYLERVYINPIWGRFGSFTHSIFSLLKSKEQVYTSTYHDNGWVSSYKFPEDSTEALGLYRREMEHFKVKPDLIKALTAQTRLWTSKGIRVFGFRPPTTIAMLQLENEMSAFDEKALIAAFTAAGGTWIPVDFSKYHSYDGSHLDEASAEKLSAFLGKEMRGKCANLPLPAGR